jgi:uncharacterized RmlC-like cupin family protein
MLAGRAEVLLGSTTFTLDVGDFLFLPRGVRHAFANPFDQAARIISVVSPGGLEGYYRDLAALPPGPRDLASMEKIMRRYGIILDVAPPPAPPGPG